MPAPVVPVESADKAAQAEPAPAVVAQLSEPDPLPAVTAKPSEPPESKPEPESAVPTPESQPEPKAEEAQPAPESESTSESKSAPRPALVPESEAGFRPEPELEPSASVPAVPAPAAKAKAKEKEKAPSRISALTSALRSRKGLYVAGSVLVAALAGGGGYWAWSQKQIADEQAAQLLQQQEADLIRKAQEQQRQLDEEAEKAKLDAEDQAALAAAEQAAAEQQARQEAQADEAARLAEIERRKARASRANAWSAYDHPPGQSFERDSQHATPMREPRPSASMPSWKAPAKLPEPPRREAEAIPSPPPTPVWIAAAVQNPLAGASEEQMVAIASQCKSLGDCVSVMLAASEPYEREAVQAALLRIPSFNPGRSATSIDMSSPETLVYQASALIDQGRSDEAERLLGSALALEPSNPANWIAMADLLAVKGQRGAASHALILAYELWPNRLKARQFFERQAVSADRAELRPAYQAALRAVQMVRLRAK